MSEPAPFAIGTSTSVAASSNVDMSLDDLIATRRKKNPPRTAKNNAARQTGQNKARRGAAVAARRGLAAKTKPTKMEEDRQVKRSSNATSRVGGGTARGGGMRGTAPRPSDVKARAKARLTKARTVIAQQKKNVKQGGKGGGASSGGVNPPTQQAVSAAARAMKDFGFKAPKGMQMQISFVPKPAPKTAGGGKGGRGGRGGRGGNNNNNNGRGGRGRGGRGRR